MNFSFWKSSWVVKMQIVSTVRVVVGRWLVSGEPQENTERTNDPQTDTRSGSAFEHLKWTYGKNENSHFTITKLVFTWAAALAKKKKTFYKSNNVLWINLELDLHIQAHPEADASRLSMKQQWPTKTPRWEETPNGPLSERTAIFSHWLGWKENGGNISILCKVLLADIQAATVYKMIFFTNFSLA